MNNTYLRAEASRIDIAARQAVSVQVSVGTRIQCMRGNVWVTQQSDVRDYCFAAGLTFCVDKPGQAVLTSLNGASIVLIRTPDSCPIGDMVPGTIRIESLEQLTGAARQARSDCLAGVISRLIRGPLAVLRRLRQTGCPPGKTARNT